MASLALCVSVAVAATGAAAASAAVGDGTPDGSPGVSAADAGSPAVVPGLPVSSPGLPAFVPGEIVLGLRGGDTRVVELAPGTSVKSAIATLERDPGVVSAARNWIATAALNPRDQGSSGTPGGWRAEQWNLLGGPGGVRAPAAWSRLARAGAPGGAGVTVAVVDTGIAYADAPGGFVRSPDFGPDQFAPGIDIVDGDGLPLDDNGHGTHVAGTIGEQVTLGTPAPFADHLTGLAYGARLMPVRVLDRRGRGTAADVADGVTWAARNGADVINLSLQFERGVRGCRQVPVVCAATRRAARAGALVVGAAGNTAGGGAARALFPGAAPGVFAVGATTEHGCLAGYSHYGDRVDLLAPGGGRPRGTAARPGCRGDSRLIAQLSFDCFRAAGCERYDRFAIRTDLGTSMAAAHVSAAAALVEASGVAGADPSPRRIARRLRCTARPEGPRRFGRDGALDALRAVDPRLRCR